MSFDHFERGYLLPKGCKDLIDVINLQARVHAEKLFFKLPSSPPNQPPAIKGDLYLQDHVTIKQLADLLGQKPFKIIADAMELGTFANVDQPLDFTIVSQIVAKYGFTAKKQPGDKRG